MMLVILFYFQNNSSVASQNRLMLFTLRILATTVKKNYDIDACLTVMMHL
jgi:hypothetical protein